MPKFPSRIPSFACAVYLDKRRHHQGHVQGPDHDEATAMKRARPRERDHPDQEETAYPPTRCHSIERTCGLPEAQRRSRNKQEGETQQDGPQSHQSSMKLTRNDDSVLHRRRMHIHTGRLCGRQRTDDHGINLQSNALHGTASGFVCLHSHPSNPMLLTTCSVGMHC